MEEEAGSSPRRPRKRISRHCGRSTLPQSLQGNVPGSLTRCSPPGGGRHPVADRPDDVARRGWSHDDPDLNTEARIAAGHLMRVGEIYTCECGWTSR